MVRAKGSYGNGLGEERLLLCTIVVALREYAEALEAGGQPKPSRVYTRPGGQFVAEVFPQGLEAMFFGNYCGEVWITPGKEPTQGRLYHDIAAGKKQRGSVGLVLGAGNQVSVLVLDVLHMLLAENAVVICKFNPVLDYLGPYVEALFKPLVDLGFVRVAYGGAEQGKLLCGHAAVDRIHLTGSAATYNAVVWGGKPKDGHPPLKKPVTAELGCVTPYLVVPGAWTESDVEYYAEECVGGLINNAGHNCNKPEVLVTCRAWPQREAFVAAVRRRLAHVPRRVAWYPGSEKRLAAFKAKHGDLEELGELPDGAAAPLPANLLPWLFKSGLAPEEADTETENWCGVLQEVALPCSSEPAAFLEQAVAFANDRCWGSLSCSVIAAPETEAQALDKALADLRYGSITINAPSFVGYSFPKLSWGAFPGNTPQAVGSGIGAVHNTMLFDEVEKSVVRAPWRSHPAHLWAPGTRNLDATTWHAIRFMASPGLLGLTTTAVNALRG